LSVEAPFICRRDRPRHESRWIADTKNSNQGMARRLSLLNTSRKPNLSRQTKYKIAEQTTTEVTSRLHVSVKEPRHTGATKIRKATSNPAQYITAFV
jgi:hypothetical protein